MDPINTRTLQRLQELCEQLHLSQGAIDDAISANLHVAPVPGFRYAVLAFTQRLHAALQGKQPALVLQQLADVEAICLGLSAFANVKGLSAYPADARLMDEALHALDGITACLLASVEQQQGIASMRYGQMLTVHNWISRACKARLLRTGSACSPGVKMFSEDVFDEFLRGALVWKTSGHLSRELDEHNLGKTAAELATMLQYGLVSFVGKEDSLAQVVAWLSSEQAFKLLLAADRGVGLSSLFNLFKRLLDIGARAGTATATATTRPGVVQDPSQAEADLLATLWKQMITSVALLQPGRLLENEGRLLAACVNLLRAMHESGLPAGWNNDQRLSYANAGRRLLDMVISTDPDKLLGLSLQTLANLVSFIKAWHKHELQRIATPAPADAQVVERQDEQAALSAEMLNRIELAAKQVTTTLMQFRLAKLDKPETVGGLRKGLFYLRNQHLIAPELATSLLTALARAAVPASESDVNASELGENEGQQSLSLQLGRYLKPGSGAGAKPVRTHVVGDRPLKTQPVVTTVSETTLSSLTISSRNSISRPTYARSDTEGFVSTSRVAKKKYVSQEVVARGQALLELNKEMEQEEEEHPLVESRPDKGMTAQHNAKKPSSNQPAQGKNKGSRKKNRHLGAPARDRNDDIPPMLPEASSLPAKRVLPATTPRQRRGIAKALFDAVKRKDEARALALLAGPGGEQIAGSVDDHNISLLHEAARMQMLSLMQALLAYPEGRKRATQSDNFGFTPLYLAAENGNMAILESLLAVDEVVLGVYQRAITGHDPVSVAIENNHAAALQRLMQIDAVHKHLPGWLNGESKTMLEVAVASRSAAALRILLTHPELARQAASPARFGFKELRPDNDTMSLARQAANVGDLPTVSVLLEITSVRQFEGASKEGLNLVGMALHSGNTALVEHVLQFPELHRLAGMCTASGCTPLMLAVCANDTKLFTRLLQIPEVRSTVLSSPGKQYAMPLKWPANLSAEPFEYGDVLELAIKKKQSAMVGTLLQVQQVSDAINTRGEYAQHLLLVLISHKMTGPLETLLQHPTIVRIACIADLLGKTALHHAAQRGERDIVQLLLERLPASEINRTDKANKTAADLARRAGHDDLADFLASVARVRRFVGIQ
ncbi:MAG TPA: ankyrin repeat domain-containing protein [Noviherbaspirillum sp.]